MTKKAHNLRYCDQLQDGRYVLKYEPGRIVIVGGTTIEVEPDEEIELRKAAK